MKISVIMPSFLGEYEGCATNREEKFIRAVNSFLSNNYEDKELIIVADKCTKTKELVEEHFTKEISDGIIKLEFVAKKQKLFSGNLRTIGIEKAKGNYIVYLDSDDILGDKHIKSIAEQIKSNKLDWGYYNDFIYLDEGLQTKTVQLQKDSIGTSSIFHKNLPTQINWKNCDGYGHDWLFVQKLIKFSKNYDKIYGASYIICHIPNLIDK